MKNKIVYFLIVFFPFFGAAQNTGMRMGQQQMQNQMLMKKMMTPEKIDFQKMVKREESRIERLETENVKFNKELEELKGYMAVLDESRKSKSIKKINKLEKKIEENNQQISNSKLFVLSYKRE